MLPKPKITTLTIIAFIIAGNGFWRFSDYTKQIQENRKEIIISVPKIQPTLKQPRPIYTRIP